jgi:transketolase
LRSSFPEHFINAGVAEQNMVGVAAGLAKSGFLPIVYGLGSFVPIRVLEQIKLDVCYEKLKVIFIGDGAGAVYTTLGVSHQTFEDMAVLRSLPNMHIFSPADAYELQWCYEQALNYDGPSYIRIGKSDLGNFHKDYRNVAKNGMTLLHQGNSNKPIIFATGSMVSVATKLIEEDFKDYSLYSVAQIKPLMESDFKFLEHNSSYLITIEEHNRVGGLGSTIAEITSTINPKKIVRVGTEDCFTKFCGSYQYAMKEHGLDKENVAVKLKEVAASLWN